MIVHSIHTLYFKQSTRRLFKVILLALNQSFSLIKWSSFNQIITDYIYNIVSSYSLY